MYIRHHKFYSRHLGQDFELKSYGSMGKPVMVFPTSSGRFWDYEERGMIRAAAEFIERGDAVFFAVDGRDWESWNKPVRDDWMARRHGHYEACVVEEAIPFIAEHCGVAEKFTATGNSLGAFHAANFFLKFPGRFDSAVCLSGVYSLKTELGGYSDAGVYLNEPLSYLPGLNDERFLSRLRDGYAVVAHGGGAWEIFNDQDYELAGLLRSKSITCWHDDWGPDWPHDWQTWHAQIRKYLHAFREGVLFRGGTLKLTGPERRVTRLEGIS